MIRSAISPSGQSHLQAGFAGNAALPARLEVNSEAGIIPDASWNGVLSQVSARFSRG